MNLFKSDRQIIVDIGNIVRIGSASEKEVSELKELTNNHTIFWGRSISTFAIAALDRLDIEKYQGDDEEIIEVIRDWEP